MTFAPTGKGDASVIVYPAQLELTELTATLTGAPEPTVYVTLKVVMRAASDTGCQLSSAVSLI